MSRTARLVQAAKALDALELAVLFGSVARGGTRTQSDVDVGVRLRDHSVNARAHVEAALARAAEADVDLVDMDDAPPLLRFEIARDGVVLVERSAHAWADFKRRAMLDWWDWAPRARLIQRAAAGRLTKRAGLGTS